MDFSLQHLCLPAIVDRYFRYRRHHQIKSISISNSIVLFNVIIVAVVDLAIITIILLFLLVVLVDIVITITISFIIIVIGIIIITQVQCISSTPQWGAADAEIKVPSGENTELTRSPFQAWSRSVYSHTCYAYCQGVLPCLF